MRAQPGRLVLFPSSLPHRVFPFSENQERISISFDIVPAWVFPICVPFRLPV